MSLLDTPRATRLHIGIFGRRNSGKSSLINALTGHETAVVSEIAGTTTDPVYKSMEIHGIGPVVFIDTAGFDDEGELGEMRVEKTQLAAEKTDIALMLFCETPTVEREWVQKLKGAGVPVIGIINKSDELENLDELSAEVGEICRDRVIIASAKQRLGMSEIREAIIRALPEDFMQRPLVGELAKEGDIVLLVMPQDIQAPKGRLILPQVQTLRELLDKKCLVMSCTTDKLSETLAALSSPPHLIITDSQAFAPVYELKPPRSLLTSFSVLMAAQKGDIHEFVRGAEAISKLTESSRVLIAEACTHAPLAEDIGREKIPAMLRAKAGKGLTVDVVSGTDFPSDLSPYDLIIHCGACMFNRRYVLSRIERASQAGVPITNYGITIAYLKGILDKIAL